MLSACSLLHWDPWFHSAAPCACFISTAVPLLPVAGAFYSGLRNVVLGVPDINIMHYMIKQFPNNSDRKTLAMYYIQWLIFVSQNLKFKAHMVACFTFASKPPRDLESPGPFTNKWNRCDACTGVPQSRNNKPGLALSFSFLFQLGLNQVQIAT